MGKQIGDWIEVDDRIYEIVLMTETEYITKEVLYREPTFKLKYSKDFSRFNRKKF